MNDPWSAIATSLPELRERAPCIEGADPIVPTPFRIGAAASAAIGAAAAAAATLGELRGLGPQQARVDLRQAAAALTSFLWLKVDGAPFPAPQGELPTMAIYRCADGRWIHLHGALPRLRDGTLALLGCEDRAASIAAAVACWPSFALEDALAAAGQCGRRAAQRGRMGRAPAGKGARRRPAGRAGEDRRRAAARVRARRALARGPARARPDAHPRRADLRAHAGGARRRGLRCVVAHPTSPRRADTSHGKRSAWLDLDQPGSDAVLRRLVEGADVFSQGYRSGALDARGFGAEALARLKPGIVHVSINAYGHRGPWSGRRGWEQLAQACTGVALEHSDCDAAGDARPAVIPAAPSDYCSGYLAACGAMLALRRQAREGGSWQVRVSLARTAMWLRELGRVAQDSRVMPLTVAEIDRWSQTSATGWGTLTHLAPVARLDATPPHWALPSAPPGSHPPEW